MEVKYNGFILLICLIDFCRKEKELFSFSEYIVFFNI